MISVTEEWLREVQEGWASHDSEVSRLKWEVRRLKSAPIESAPRRLAALEAILEKLDERFAKERATVLGWQSDPAVLVRRFGGYHKDAPYHSASNPCGRVSKRSRFETMLRGRARELGHSACDTCGWR